MKDFDFRTLVIIAAVIIGFLLGALAENNAKKNKPVVIPTWRFTFHGDTIYLDNGRSLERRSLYDFKLTDKGSYTQGTGLFDTLKFTMLTK